MPELLNYIANPDPNYFKLVFAELPLSAYVSSAILSLSSENFGQEKMDIEIKKLARKRINPIRP